MGQQPFPWEFFAQGGESPVITQAAGVRVTAPASDAYIKRITEAMRDFYGIKVESNNKASASVGSTLDGMGVPIENIAGAPVPSDKKDESYKWTDEDSRKLVNEITNEAFRELQAADPTVGEEVWEQLFRGIGASFLGERSVVNPDFNVNSAEFETLNITDQIINKTVVKFENLAGRSKNNPNMLFRVTRLAEWRDSMYGQGLISDDVYDALRNPSLNFKDESVQEQASMITQMLIINEPAWTDKVVQDTTTSFDKGTKKLLGTVSMQDIVEGTPSDVTDLLPLPAVTRRNLIAQQREEALYNKFGSTKNLKTGTELLLGTVIEDEDGVNKATRAKFLEMANNYRTSIIMENPMLTEDEIERMTYQYIIGSQTPQMGEYPGDDRSPYDRIWEAEAVKVRNQKREDTRKTAFGKLDTDSKVQTAIKAFIEDPNNFGSGAAVDTATLNELVTEYRRLVIEADATGMPVPDINAFMSQWNQQRTADGVPTLGQSVAAKYFGDYTADETRLDTIRTNLNLGPERPTDRRLFPTGDYGAVRQIDIEKQKLFKENPSLLMTAAGRKQVDDQVRNMFAGYGMTPSGDLAEWSGTYRDPVTGELKFAQGQDFVDNINNFDPITQYLFARAGTAYNPGFVSPAEMFAIQRGSGVPSLPSWLFGSTGMDTRYTTKDGITPMKVVDGKQVVDMDKVTKHRVPSGPWTPSPGYTPPDNTPPNITTEPYFDLGYKAIQTSVPEPQEEFDPYPQNNIFGINNYDPDQYGKFTPYIAKLGTAYRGGDFQGSESNPFVNPFNDPVWYKL